MKFDTSQRSCRQQMVAVGLAENGTQEIGIFHNSRFYFFLFACRTEKKWIKGHCICLTSNKSRWRKYLCCSLLRWWSSADWTCQWIQVMKTLFETKANRKSHAQVSLFSHSIVVNRSVYRFGAIHSRWLHNFSQAHQVRWQYWILVFRLKYAWVEITLFFVQKFWINARTEKLVLTFARVTSYITRGKALLEKPLRRKSPFGKFLFFSFRKNKRKSGKFLFFFFIMQNYFKKNLKKSKIFRAAYWLRVFFARSFSARSKNFNKIVQKQLQKVKFY